MKKTFLFFCLTFLISYTEAMCQCITTLSKNGNAHLRAAETLIGMATSAEDYELVATELKQVVNSDPDYAPTYMKLGKLYTQIGNFKGDEAFDLAKYYYERCQEVCPDSTDAILVEIAILNALHRKYTNGPNRFSGTWGTWETWYDGSFSPRVEISYNGNGYSFRVIGYYADQPNFTIESESEKEIIFTYTSVFYHMEDLRKKGWSKYYDNCDNNADSGYSQSGRYYYNETRCTYRISFAIEGEKVIKRNLMIHSDYYLNGQKTYADTKFNWLPSTELEKYR